MFTQLPTCAHGQVLAAQATARHIMHLLPVTAPGAADICSRTSADKSCNVEQESALPAAALILDLFVETEWMLCELHVTPQF